MSCRSGALALAVVASSAVASAGCDHTPSVKLSRSTSTTSAAARSGATGSTSAPARRASAPRRAAPRAVGPRPPAPGSAVADPVTTAAAGGIGDFAGPMLAAASPVKKLVYEVMAQDGLGLRPATLDHVLTELRTYSGKPVSVVSTAVPGGPSTWTPDELAAFADQHAQVRSAGDTAAIHVLVVHGQLDDTAGVSVTASTSAVFPDGYRGGGLTASEAQIEDCVAVHELGHLLGLVDLWLDEHRGDFSSDPAPGGHHSPDPNSVMYWRVESFDVKNFFRGGPPNEFDDADQQDLRAIHAGAPSARHP